MFTKRQVANCFSFALALTLVLALPAQADDRGVAAQTREGASGKRMALVIGNGAYKTGRLRNPVNDARAMARVLERLGFQVTKGEDLSLSQMRRIIDRFGLQLRGAEVGLFYYAGHGIQVDGRNYLIPVDALLRDKPDVEYEAVKAGRVLAKMQSAETKLNLVLLDACRNNPFARSFRNAVSQGLAYMDAPSGSVIAYATAPGSVAADGRGDNSPFAAALSRHLGQPGVSVDRALKRTGAEVHRETNGKQEPWISTNYYGEYFLAGGATPPPVQLAGGPGPAVDQRKENLSRLLRQAEADLAAGRLTTPKGNNAYERYRQVLSLEPYNATANEGLKRIVGKYVALAQGRLKAGDLARAEAYLARAEKISEADDRVLAARDRLRGAKQSAAKSQPQVAPPPSNLPKGFTNSIGMEFVLIPAGSFTMGSRDSAEEVARKSGKETEYFQDEHPRHRVTIRKPFYMQSTEVTQGQWRAVMGNNPSHFRLCGNDCPVEQVSWQDAQDFIRRLNRKEGTNKYRLPTEAQWEYACRAGTTTPFSFGKTISTDQANYDGSYVYGQGRTGVNRRKPVSVKSFPPNAWGLYDMHGNIQEWVSDWYGGKYSSSPAYDPKGSISGKYRVLRGGSWCSFPGFARSARRNRDYPSGRSDFIGFRVVREVP